jgi:hypothetical protein
MASEADDALMYPTRCFLGCCASAEKQNTINKAVGKEQKVFCHRIAQSKIQNLKSKIASPDHPICPS